MTTARNEDLLKGSLIADRDQGSSVSPGGLHNKNLVPGGANGGRNPQRPSAAWCQVAVAGFE